MEANETNDRSQYSCGYRDAIRDVIELQRERLAALYSRDDEHESGGFMSTIVIMVLVFVIVRSLLALTEETNS